MTVPIASLAAVSVQTPDVLTPQFSPARLAPSQRVSFSQLFSDGIDDVSRKADAADAMVKAFVVDDTIPPHQVMYALEQSQLALQMMMQVRNRLVEDYQDIMRMQL